MQNNYKNLKIINIKFFKKGLLILGTTLFFANPLTANSPIIANIQKPTDIFMNTVLSELKLSQNKNYVPNNIVVTLKPLELKIHERSEDYTANTRADGKCEIIISLNSEGYVDYAGSMENRLEFHHITIPQNQQEAEIMRQIMVLHEASHCEFSNFQEPLLVKGMPQLQKNLNYLYKNSSFSQSKFSHNEQEQKNSSIYQLLNENFADTYAAIQIIKLHGAKPQVLNMLLRFKVQRHEQSLLFSRSYGLESHDSHFALEEILEPDNIQKILNTDDAQELKIIALEIANNSIGKVLVNHSFEQAINKKSIIRGIVETIDRIKFQEFVIANNQFNRITNYQFHINENNSFIFKVAKAIKSDINLSMYEDQKSLSDKYKFVDYNLANMSGFSHSKYVNSFINTINNQYKNYIYTNFKPDSLNYISFKEDIDTVNTKFTIIKNDFMNDLKVMELLTAPEINKLIPEVSLAQLKNESDRVE